MKKIVIAIDGYSGTGKSSTARQVAAQLDYLYIDSGAMYRAVTLFLLKNRVNISDPKEVLDVLPQCKVSLHSSSIFLNGEKVDDDIRTMSVNEHVSQVSAIPQVREMLVEQQREIGKAKGIVMDGRDIGTVVFPTADLKVFMTADMDIRAERRRKELLSKGVVEDIEAVKANLASRDKKDSSRADSPLRKAEDAIEIDTSHLTLNEQIDKIVAQAKSIIYES